MRAASTPRADRWAAKSDEELLADLTHDEVSALGALYERHHERVFALCYRLTGDPQVAADLSHECFLRVRKYGKGFEGRSTFTSWLYRLARNVCLDHHRTEDRSRARARAWASERASEARSMTHSDPRIDTLYAALYGLAPDKREVLVLSRYEGMSYAEIADVCGTTVGAIKVRAHRAMRELRQRFEELRRSS